MPVMSNPYMTSPYASNPYAAQGQGPMQPNPYAGNPYGAAMQNAAWKAAGYGQGGGMAPGPYGAAGGRIGAYPGLGQGGQGTQWTPEMMDAVRQWRASIAGGQGVAGRQALTQAGMNPYAMGAMRGNAPPPWIGQAGASPYPMPTVPGGGGANPYPMPTVPAGGLQANPYRGRVSAYTQPGGQNQAFPGWPPPAARVNRPVGY